MSWPKADLLSTTFSVESEGGLVGGASVELWPLSILSGAGFCLVLESDLLGLVGWTPFPLDESFIAGCVGVAFVRGTCVVEAGSAGEGGAWPVRSLSPESDPTPFRLTSVRELREKQ